MDLAKSMLDRLLPGYGFGGPAAANVTANATVAVPSAPVELPPSFLGENAIFYAYGALLTMAVVPIVLGARSSVQFKKVREPWIRHPAGGTY